MKFKLPELPYPMDAFQERFVSAESFEFHYGKHHRAYIDAMNILKAEQDRDLETLESLLMTSEGKLFNQSAQAYNHTFFWNCLSPKTTVPSDHLARGLHTSFGDFAHFRKAFVEAGKNQFGSGWVWLVKDVTGRLSILSTANAENPIRQRKIPLLVADVWEHAYYIDYRNDRAGFLERFLDFVNWDFVSQNLESSALASLTPFMVDIDPEAAIRSPNIRRPRNDSGATSQL